MTSRLARMEPWTPKLADIAHHEAGHAVVAHVLSMRIRRVWIPADPKTGWGCCDIEPLPPPGSLAEEMNQVRDMICFWYGGIAADLHRAGKQFDDWPADRPRGWGTDIREAKRLAYRHAPWENVAERLMSEMQQRASAINAEHWSAVAAVAGPLELRYSLDGDEAHGLIEAAPKAD